MKTHKDLVQKTDEWNKIRLGKFTASKADVICVNGVGLKTLVAEKVAELVTGVSSENDFLSQDMERGIVLEENARNFYELETGSKVKQVGFIENDDGMSGFSPDGLVGEDGLIEIKSINNTNFVKIKIAMIDENKDDKKSDLSKILKAYIPQVQMQLLESKRKWCDLIFFNENFDESIIIIRFEPDLAVFEKLEAGLTSGKFMVKEYLQYFPQKGLER